VTQGVVQAHKFSGPAGLKLFTMRRGTKGKSTKVKRRKEERRKEERKVGK
jgi:hypothetical protein